MSTSAPNTKARRDEIFAAAVALVEAFGIERLDALPQPAAKAQKVAFAHQLAEQVDCHIETARIHIAKVSRRMRSPAWGGTRPGSGRKSGVTPHLDGET